MATLPGVRSAPLDEAIILALGGNLAGDYPSLEALLEAALSAFLGAGIRVMQRSGWWRSAAWPDPRAPAYLNGVVVVETELGPHALMDRLGWGWKESFWPQTDGTGTRRAPSTST